MSRLQELIQKFCPDGVAYQTLGELGTFYGGLSGKSKEDFREGNAPFITYMNVFQNISLKMDRSETVQIAPNEKQNILQYGDVLFTGSSETLEECGMSSVLTEHTDEKLYLNSFCFGYRFNQTDLILPDFAKYLFRSETLRKQIKKTASGVTRFNISKKKMEKVRIPLPPLPVQMEIVRILDTFAELTEKLTGELAARKKQYAYFRDKLLTFHDVGSTVPRPCHWTCLGDVCQVAAGGTPSRKNSEYWTNGTVKWLGSAVCKNQKTVDEVTDYITELGLSQSSARMMKKNTTLIALVGATIGKVAFLPFEASINQNVAGVYPKDTRVLNPSYVYYVCTTLYPQFLALTQGSKLAMANLSFVRSLQIPIPAIAIQNRIVQVLDQFEAICTDLHRGLPAEIEARQKQYEYFRDRLLTFPPIKSINRSSQTE